MRIRTSRLPAGYREVEYLESATTQYIDTGITANSTSIISYTFQYVSLVGSYNRIFGARNGNGNGLLNQRTTSSSGGGFFLESAGGTWSTSSTDFDKHEMVLNGVTQKLYNNGTQVLSSLTIADNTEGTMWLFGTNQGGTNSNVRFYSYSHIKGDVLVQKLIPCVRVSDSKPGMYDVVNGNFLVNQASGVDDFSVGGYVNDTYKVALGIEGVSIPVEYQQVEYIYQEKQADSGTGNLAYIQSNLSFADIDKVEFDLSIASTGGSQNNIVLCAYNTSFYIIVDMNTHRVNGFSSSTWDPSSTTLFSDGERHQVSVSGLSSSNTTAIRTAWDWTWWHETKWYGLKLYKNNVLLQNLIPCYRKSDNVIGMYDTISNTFFSNAGAGTLLKGKNIYNSGKISIGNS